MMTPRLPLILLAVLMAPVLGFLWLDPETALLAPMCVLFVVLIALWDWWQMRGVFNGVSIALLNRPRLSKGRHTGLVFEIQSKQRSISRLDIGIPFPLDSFICERVNKNVALANGSNQVMIDLLPIKRGAYQIEHVHLQTASKLGLWYIRGTAPLGLSLRVYLEPMRERKTLAAIFLNRQGLGVHVQRQVGQGREFEKLRDFLSGDALSDVHWRATAKRSMPVTREYRIERTQEIYVAIDASRLSAKPAEPLEIHPPLAPGERITLLERYLSSAMILGAAVEKQGDLFGLLSYHNRVTGFMRAASGQAHYQACRNLIYQLEPEPVTPDIGVMFSYVRERLRRRSLIFILTQLDDPVVAERFLQAAELISRRHLVVVGMMVDQDIHPMFANPKVTEPEQLYNELAAHLRWRKLRELAKVLKRRGVEFLQLDRDSMTLQLVTTYMNIKQRQLL